MANALHLGGPAFIASASHRLSAISESKKKAVSETLHDVFAGRMALSTQYSGPRRDIISAADAADLRDLESALPDGTFSQDELLRDQFASEPAEIAFLRQLEGHRPQPMAVICAAESDIVDEAVSEARSMGYSLSPSARFMALKAPETVEVLDSKSGLVRFGAGTSWHQLSQACDANQLESLRAMAAIYPHPAAAAHMGLFDESKISRRFGRMWDVTAILPPQTKSLFWSNWLFESPKDAHDAHLRLSRDLTPLFAETYSGLDARLFSVAGLWPQKDTLTRPQTTGLRIADVAVPKLAKAFGKATDAICSEFGGQKVKLSVMPQNHDLAALLFAHGAARLERKSGSPHPCPEGHLQFELQRSLRGKITEIDVIYYLRDLSRSLQESQQCLGLLEDTQLGTTPHVQQGPSRRQAHG